MGLGVLYIAGASLIFGCMPTVNKYVMLSGVTAECLTFYIQVLIGLGALVAAKCRGVSIKVTGRQLAQLMLVGALGMGATTYLVNGAALHIPVGLATVLHFLYPTIVSVAMVVLFRQRLTIFKLLAILCSIAGMVLITNLGGEEGSLQWTGILLAIASSLTYSFYMISNEKGEVSQLPLLVKLIYSALGSSILFGALVARGGTLSLPDTIPATLMTVGYCGIGSLISYYLITGGIRLIGASAASFVNMLEPVTSVVVSAVVYREDLGLSMVIGMILILSAVLVVAVDGATAHRKLSTAPVGQEKET